MADANEKKLTGKVVVFAVAAQGQTTRNRGGYTIPAVVPGKKIEPLVLDLADVHPEALAEWERDDRIVVLRNDTPLTPKRDIKRYQWEPKKPAL